jgi:hypothetical protein
MRHKLFAHSEATLAVGQDDYSHEAVIENDGKMVSLERFFGGNLPESQQFSLNSCEGHDFKQAHLGGS